MSFVGVDGLLRTLTAANAFSVATIPIATKVSKIDKANVYVNDTVNAPNTYFHGAIATIDYVYDGSTFFNFNFVGEFAYHKDYNGGGKLSTALTSNDTLQLRTSFMDLNAISSTKPTLREARKALSEAPHDNKLSPKSLLSTWYHKFNYVNLAIDKLNNKAKQSDDITLKDVDPAIRHAVKESYYEFRMFNVFHDKTSQYHVTVIRSEKHEPIKELAGDGLTKGLMPVDGYTDVYYYTD